MARCKVEGLDIFSDKLGRLADEVTRINKGALGTAAGQVADAVKSALEGMPVCEDGYTKPGHMRTGATASEKAQIIGNFGITRFRSSGSGYETSIGFAGYVATHSTRFNGNIPTGFLMQAIEYGTFFRVGTHTVSRAINSVKKQLTETVKEYIETETSKIMD